MIDCHGIADMIWWLEVVKRNAGGAHLSVEQKKALRETAELVARSGESDMK